MKTFSELLATDFNLTIEVNGCVSVHGLHEPLSFQKDDHVVVDGIEVLPKYYHLVNNNRLEITVPFYQWLHQASHQGWLLVPH